MLDKKDGEQEGDLLVVSRGGTYGSTLTAINQSVSKNKKVGLAHFNYIKPLPKNTAEVFSKYKKILVCELNQGQFVRYLRGELPQFNYQQFNILDLEYMIHEHL